MTEYIKEQIINCIYEEIEKRTFGVVDQFLSVHELVYEDGKLKISRIDVERKDGRIIVYLPVHGEDFYFAMYVRTSPEVSFDGAGIENDNCIYFVAYSEELNANQLAATTKLKPTKGYKYNVGNTIYPKYSKIVFEPHLEPDEFEDKLSKVLTFLEQDKDGVKKLVNKAGGYLQVALICHNGNGMLGGPTITKESIKRMAELDLEVNFDIYAKGNSWPDSLDS